MKKQKKLTAIERDQIAGRLKRNHPYDRHFRITAETIYRWIYQPEQIKRDDLWYEYLRRKQKKRKKYKGRKVHRAHIPDRVSIHTRDAAVNQRKQFGHWEGDTVEGRGHKDGIHTEVERMSRLIAGGKIEAITSEATIIKQKQLFTGFPKQARKSTTLDNGRETHLHYKLRSELGMKTSQQVSFLSWYLTFKRIKNKQDLKKLWDMWKSEFRADLPTRNLT